MRISDRIELMTDLPRIYFSTNDPIGDNRYGLDFPSSLRDIAAWGVQLKAGQRATLYDPGEVEVEVALEWDEIRQLWIAVPDWTTERWEY